MAGAGFDVDALVRAAGFAPDEPVSLAVLGTGMPIVHAAGRWPSGAAVASSDLFYAASLTKQLTGAAVALLVRDGRLDPDAPIPERFLPKWPVLPTVRQLLHHIGGLPAAGPAEAALDHKPWTNAHVRRLLAGSDPPIQPPGAAHAYSNLGYIVLARLVEQATCTSFPDFVAERILKPLGLGGGTFASGAVLPHSPQAALLGPSLPLSSGDGGLWTTATAFASWLDAQNHDALGIAGLVEADAVLPSGEPVRYGWGIGLRQFRGHRLFIHGGGWTNARAKAVRCPALGLSVVVLAAIDREEPVLALADALLEKVA